MGGVFCEKCYEKSQFIEKLWKCLDLFDDKQSIKEKFWNKNTEKIKYAIKHTRINLDKLFKVILGTLLIANANKIMISPKNAFLVATIKIVAVVRIITDIKE